MWYIILIIVVGVLWFFFNSEANKIRKTNNLLQKDPTLVDYINSKVDWNISTTPTDGITFVLFPPFNLPAYKLYLTYKGKHPEKMFDMLYKDITRKRSIVTRAHRANITVDEYSKRVVNEQQIAEATEHNKKINIARLSYETGVTEKEINKTIEFSNDYGVKLSFINYTQDTNGRLTNANTNIRTREITVSKLMLCEGVSFLELIKYEVNRFFIRIQP